jgi:hypothetical protein
MKHETMIYFLYLFQTFSLSYRTYYKQIKIVNFQYLKILHQSKSFQRFLTMRNQYLLSSILSYFMSKQSKRGWSTEVKCEFT